MSPTEIKELLKAERIPYWQLADALGVHENTIVRKLRHNLTDAEYTQFIEAIEAIKANSSLAETNRLLRQITDKSKK